MSTKAWYTKALRKPKFMSRKVSRCWKCGRVRGYLRDFNACRICVREMANRGQIPGMRKSSW
ncbi:MAG TPA: type Z 30S ribosomal protein S14 [Candidatus Magasanikbacteria bacterium]|nr:type Z 30S ribosomal protein S14 [Candidatus Magasanikbacteria bacterium]